MEITTKKEHVITLSEKEFEQLKIAVDIASEQSITARRSKLKERNDQLDSTLLADLWAEIS